MMKYLAVDIETTGLNPETDQVLEVAMVYDDLNDPLPIETLPVFHCYVKHDIYTGNPIALAMNQEILEILGGKRETAVPIYPVAQLKAEIGAWLDTFLPEESVNVAGKNVHFDIGFLKKATLSMDSYLRFGKVKFRHRQIDLGNLFWNPLVDKELPNSTLCMERAGLGKSPSHKAIDDALDVVKMVRIFRSRV